MNEEERFKKVLNILVWIFPILFAAGIIPSLLGRGFSIYAIGAFVLVFIFGFLFMILSAKLVEKKHWIYSVLALMVSFTIWIVAFAVIGKLLVGAMSRQSYSELIKVVVGGLLAFFFIVAVVVIIAVILVAILRRLFSFIRHIFFKDKKMKRPGLVWMYSIVSTILIIFGIYLNIYRIEDPLIGLGPMYIIRILSLVLIIPQGIFIYLFFNLKKSSLTWLYIVFGFSIILALVGKQWTSVIFIFIGGWILRDYISRKQWNNKQLFT